MNFIEFRNEYLETGCVSTYQIAAKWPDFNSNNLTRWAKQGLLVKLRQGYYSFPELKARAGFAYYVSNRIYKPSYVSLHSALAFYGIIPEAVTQTTAVSSLKTAEFVNDFGWFSYKTIKPGLMFGYESKPFSDRSILFAYPEKALLDLLYLYPFYNTQEEMTELRLDEDYLENELDKDRFDDYLDKFRSKALAKRAMMLKQTYGI